MERIHGNRSQAQRTQALAGFKSGRFQVLVATDIAARGIDIDALSHVVNFDVPRCPRTTSTAWAGRRGPRRAATRFTLVAPSEEGGSPPSSAPSAPGCPRVTLPDFDYGQRPAERLEIPLAERLAAIRAQRAGARRSASGRSPTRGRTRTRRADVAQPTPG